jgi:hypothetical protein
MDIDLLDILKGEYEWKTEMEDERVHDWMRKLFS